MTKTKLKKKEAEIKNMLLSFAPKLVKKYPEYFEGTGSIPAAAAAT